jgi:hypothetical protein
MSLSLWVQFFRNLFCVGKSLLPASNFLQQIPFPHAQFYPLTLTTAVEEVFFGQVPTGSVNEKPQAS